ncbi:hypothetical protein [Treponema endosymbiont of Eucomonympha sp.]|uniref:hypothetical protein n=1 Tax=Treponema endosymbiont of Eucomonympha sp. TaxID=1580831 RepID=UPI001396A6B5|nr:hypothetical protein [Treponema endosymbiont of Eucomonympha sp.]
MPNGAASAKQQFPAFAFVFAKRSDCEKKGLEALANAGLPVLGSYTDSTDGHVFIVNASSVRHFVYNNR